MPTLRCVLLILAFVCLLPIAKAQELQIYFLDVDGGQATLIVVDGKASMLVDAGWPGFEGRDTLKILAAAKDAGISRLDIMFTTHYHTDHVGGVPQLAAKLPITRFVDHGPVLEKSENASRLYQRYLEVRAKGEHQRVSAGDSFRLGNATLHVVSARKELTRRALRARSAGATPEACKDASTMPGDNSENEMSIGTVLEYGRFRFLNLADLLWNEEQALACPV
ncbi:MAG: MBL fold metallo-hydrolase, partial [Bryobacterales bacterium]|nr:MBL fold metallo-hydrolase [Bryobacterales bacterium]